MEGREQDRRSRCADLVKEEEEEGRLQFRHGDDAAPESPPPPSPSLILAQLSIG